MAAMAGPSPQLADIGGLNSGFLGRVTVLEREIKFLKAKVEEDSRWKTILEGWILSNFAFDLRGALLKRIQPDLYPNSQATLQKPNMKKSSSSRHSKAKSEGKISTTAAPTSTRGGGRGRGGRRAANPPKRGRKRKQEYVESSEEEEEEEDLFGGNFDGDFSDYGADELDPRDLIITPDAKEVRSCRRKVMKTERESPPDEILSDCEGLPGTQQSNNDALYFVAEVGESNESNDSQPTKEKIRPVKAGIRSGSGRKGRKAEGGGGDADKSNKKADEDKQSSESSSDEDSEEFKNSYPRKKMDWNLLSIYPNYDVMLKSFPLQRDWAIHTSCSAMGKVKKYYYCKMCSKKGPIRIQVRYEKEDAEVEILQNSHSHDHDYSKRRFLCEEMKSEIFTLYRAGLKNSTQIIDAIKTSKPDLKVPTAKQVTFLLKATRKQDIKTARKLKKQQAEDVLRKAQVGVVVSQIPMSRSTTQPQVSNLNQTYSSPGGMQMGGAQMPTLNGNLNNSHSGGYGQGIQVPPTPSNTPNVPTSQFTYDQQLLLQQFAHLSNQSHHQ